MSGAGSRRNLILLVAGALVVLVVIAWAVVSAAFPPARVRELIVARLSATLDREVRIEDASFTLWPPVRFVMKRPALAEPGGFVRGEALRAEALDLDVDPFALLARRLVIRRLSLDRPTVHLVLNPDGTTNFDRMVKPSPGSKKKASSAAMDLAVNQLSLRGARFVIDDLRTRRRTTFQADSRIALKVAGGTRIETDGRTTLSGFARGPSSAARLADLDQSLAGILLAVEHRGRWDAPKKRLALERLALRMGKAEAAFTGTIGDPGPRAIVDLTGRGSNVDVAELLRALSAASLPALHGVSGSGRADFNLAARGTLGPGRSPALTGVLRVREGAFRYPGTQVAVNGVGFTARFAPDSLGIGDLVARVGDQPIKAALSMTRFADPRVRFLVDGLVDLAAVGPLVAPPDVKLSGRAALHLIGEGRLRDRGAMNLNGSSRFAEISIRSPSLPKVVEHVRGDVTFSGTRAVVRGLSASAGQSSFALDASVERPLALMAKPDSVPPAIVSFTLNSPYLDLSELLPPVPGPTLLPNARGQGRVTIARLRQGKLDVSRVNSTVTFDPRNLTAPDFALEGYGGAVSGSARFDLTDPANPAYRVKAKVDTVQADALLSTWTPAKNVLRGALSTTLDLSGVGTRPEQMRRTLTAIGQAVVANGEFGPTPALEAIAALTRIRSFQKVTFRHLDMPFKVENGKIAMREIALNGPSGDWRASGLLGFDGALDYSVMVLVPREQVDQLGSGAALLANALTDAQGRVRLAFRVGGTAASPRVSLDAQAMRDAAAGRVNQVLEQQKSRIEEQLRQVLNPRPGASDSSRGGSTQSFADSLKKIKGSDVLKDLLGIPRKKKAAPADTAVRNAAVRDTVARDSAAH